MNVSRVAYVMIALAISLTMIFSLADLPVSTFIQFCIACVLSFFITYFLFRTWLISKLCVGIWKAKRNDQPYLLRAGRHDFQPAFPNLILWSGPFRVLQPITNKEDNDDGLWVMSPDRGETWNQTLCSNQRLAVLLARDQNLSTIYVGQLRYERLDKKTYCYHIRSVKEIVLRK